MTLDTTQPSRELDAAVATIIEHSTDVLTLHYSNPQNNLDRSALLDCVLWLARRGCSIHITQDLQSCEVSQYRYDDEFTFVRVPGTDDAAFALAVCRAVVLVAERGEP